MPIGFYLDVAFACVCVPVLIAGHFFLAYLLLDLIRPSFRSSLVRKNRKS